MALITKQIIKINKNYIHKSLWPNIYTLGERINSYDKIFINDNFYYYYASDGDNLCMYSTSPCTSYKLLKNKFEANKKLTYTIISLKHD